MQPEERNPAYLWDMLQDAKEVEAMLEEHDLAAFAVIKDNISTVG